MTLVLANAPILGVESLITIEAWLFLNTIIWFLILPNPIGSYVLMLFNRKQEITSKDFGFFYVYLTGWLITLPTLFVIFYLSINETLFIFK
jgi:hypothetical protein